MNKKNIIIISFLLFLLIGIGVVTYAMLVQSSVATSSSIAAKWRFKVNGQKETFNVDLLEHATKLMKGKIAPGSSGYFDIVLDGTGSQVGIDYEISFENLENVPTNMKFYANSSKTNQVRLSSYEITGTIAYANNMTRTFTIYWEWPLNGGEDDASFAGRNLTFDIVVNAVQDVG